MASIRRTQSPAHLERACQNSHSSSLRPSPPASSTPASSPPQRPSSLFRAAALRQSVIGAFSFQRQPRKWARKWFFRLLLFFLIGFLLGFSPFGGLGDIRPHDMSFEIRTPRDDVAVLAAARRDIERRGVHIRRDNRVIETVKADNIIALELETVREMGGLAEPHPGKLLIIVTPTYNRALQAFYLNRLGQMLRLVPPPLLWIVVEMRSASMETADILRRTGVMYRHLVCNKNNTKIKDRGVHQRNTAIKHIKHHKLDGIVYFADDDNVYSLELFTNMREIRRFGTWPVAMLAESKSKAILEGPVCNGSHLIGWHTNEKSKRLRRFHVDMSGFAFNSTMLWNSKRWPRPFSDKIRQLDTVKEGFQETTFIAQLVEDESQMEGIPHGCSRIMNWHLHLEAGHLVYPRGWRLLKNLEVVIPLT